jgi:NADH-quinone oxidoreductase subunit H
MFALLELQYSMLLILIIGSLNVHTIIFAGWSSNSKYAFLGGVRAASQMISYEICLGTVFASVILMCGSFTLVDVVYSQVSVWFVLPLFPVWVLFVITSLAETNRTPFDLVEAEAELVAGYNVEYSAMPFAMLFIAEYGNIMFMSALSTIFFFGGWLLPFSDTLDESALDESVSAILGSFVFATKTSINVFIFILVRATVPRYRYDQLMSIGWKVLIPISLSVLIVQCCILTYFATTGEIMA